MLVDSSCVYDTNCRMEFPNPKSQKIPKMSFWDFSWQKYIWMAIISWISKEFRTILGLGWIQTQYLRYPSTNSNIVNVSDEVVHGSDSCEEENIGQTKKLRNWKRFLQRNHFSKNLWIILTFSRTMMNDSLVVEGHKTESEFPLLSFCNFAIASCNFWSIRVLQFTEKINEK